MLLRVPAFEAGSGRVDPIAAKRRHWFVEV